MDAANAACQPAAGPTAQPRTQHILSESLGGLLGLDLEMQFMYRLHRNTVDTGTTRLYSFASIRGLATARYKHSINGGGARCRRRARNEYNFSSYDHMRRGGLLLLHHVLLPVLAALPPFGGRPQGPGCPSEHINVCFKLYICKLR